MNQKLITIAVISLIAIAGCTSGTANFQADQAIVSEDTQNETQYTLSQSKEYGINRGVSVAGQEQNVSITNHFNVYTRNTTYEPLGETTQTGFFALLSTPNAKIAGTSVNPLAKLSNKDLLTRIGERSQNVQDIEKTGNYTTTVLGEKTKVSEFTGTTTIQGTEIQVDIHMTKTTKQGNLVITLGMYPSQAEDLERENITNLLGGIEFAETTTTTE